MSRPFSRTRNPGLPTGPGRAPGWMSISRGTAAGMALIYAMNLAEHLVFQTEIRRPWITQSDLLPAELSRVLLAVTIPALLLFAFRPNLPSIVRLAALVTILLPGVFCVQSILAVSEGVSESVRYALLARPVGVLLMLAVAATGVLTGRSPSVQGRSSWLAILFAGLLTVISFPLLLLHEAGFSAFSTDDDESRLVVVPATEGEQSGRLSEQMQDRIRTAAEIVLRSEGGRLVMLRTQVNGQAPSAEELLQTAVDSGLAAQEVDVQEVSGDSVAALKLVVQKSAAADKPLLVTHWYEVARFQRQTLRHCPEVRVRSALQRNAIMGQNLIVLRESQRLLQVLLEPLLRLAATMRSPSETQLADPYSAADTAAEPDDLSGLIEPVSEESTAE